VNEKRKAAAKTVEAEAEVPVAAVESVPEITEAPASAVEVNEEVAETPVAESAAEDTEETKA